MNVNIVINLRMRVAGLNLIFRMNMGSATGKSCYDECEMSRGPWPTSSF